MTEVTNNPTAVGTNAWTNPTYAYLDDANKATAVMAAKNTSIAGIWGTFGFTDPGGATTITKVEIGTQHYLSTISSIIATMGREISWDGGTSWGSHTMDETTTEVTSETATLWVECTADTTWTWTKLNDTNLKTRITCYQGNDTTGFTMYLDVIYVRVTYNVVAATEAYAAEAILAYTAPTEAYAAEAILSYMAPTEAYAAEAILSYNAPTEVYAAETILDYTTSTQPCEVYAAEAILDYLIPPTEAYAAEVILDYRAPCEVYASEAILDYLIPPCEAYAAEAVLSYVAPTEVYAAEAILNYEVNPCEIYAAESVLSYTAPCEVYAAETILSYEVPPCEAYAAEAILDYTVAAFDPCEAYAAEAILDYTQFAACEAYAAEAVLDYELPPPDPCEVYAAEIVLDYTDEDNTLWYKWMQYWFVTRPLDHCHKRYIVRKGKLAKCDTNRWPHERDKHEGR